MRVKKIEGFEGRAKKVGGNGSLKYQLWIDDSGKLYVYITDNEQGGTLSDLLYSVEENASIKDVESPAKPSGYSRTGLMQKNSENNNDGNFLKAVLRNLLPKDAE